MKRQSVYQSSNADRLKSGDLSFKWLSLLGYNEDESQWFYCLPVLMTMRVIDTNKPEAGEYSVTRTDSSTSEAHW